MLFRGSRGTRPPCSAVEALVAQAAAEHGRVAGIVNAVGSILLKPAHLTSEQELAETLRLNVQTAFAAVRAAGRTMTTGGSVLLFASSASEVGLPNHEAIAAAKGAVGGLVRSAAATYASRHLRVNAIAPGLVDTPMAARITGNPKSLEVSAAMHPAGRIGTSADVVPAARRRCAAAAESRRPKQTSQCAIAVLQQPGN